MKNQKFKPKMFVFLLFLVFTTRAFSQDPNFYIYLCFGQSNMEGAGPIEAQDKIVDNRFRIMETIDCTNLERTKGTWYTAVPPLCRCYTQLTPADYFGRTMVANLPDSIKVGVINVSAGGAKIELFDKDKYLDYVATTPDWFKNIVKEYDGNPYARLVEIAKLAQKDGVIKGFLLHQGESNTGETDWPAKVKIVYDNLIADLNLPDTLPILAGEVVNADQGGACAFMNTIIPLLPKTIPNAHVISSKGCTVQSDKLHFTSIGYRKLGTRYGVKMLEILGIKANVMEPETFNFEAECILLGKNWTFIEDSKASNNTYTTIKNGINDTLTAPGADNTISIDFTVNSDTDYYVYARINVTTASLGSFWINMDDKSFEYLDSISVSGWKWLKLKSYKLTKGEHKLSIANGKEGVNFDKIFISNTDYPPTGMGDNSTFLCSAVQKPGKLGGKIIGLQGKWPNLPDSTQQLAFDGDLNTYLDVPEADANHGWVGLDLGEGKKVVITKIRYAPRNDQWGLSRLKGGVFVASQTADLKNNTLPVFIDADTLYSIKSNPTNGNFIDVNITKSDAYRYIVFRSPAGGFNNIAELEFYGHDSVATEVGNAIHEKLSIFPNPAKNELNISFDNSTTGNISISDIQGRELMKFKIKNQKLIKIGTAELKNGMYIVKVEFNQSWVTNKIYILR